MTSLFDDIAGELPAMRARAETLMVDTIKFTVGGGAGTFAPETGTYTPGAGTEVYSGKCQIQVGDAVPRDVSSGDRPLVVERITVKIPVGSAAVPVGAVGEITAVGGISDPSLVGLVYRVTGSHAKTFATATRLPCELVTT